MKAIYGDVRSCAIGGSGASWTDGKDTWNSGRASSSSSSALLTRSDSLVLKTCAQVCCDGDAFRSSIAGGGGGRGGKETFSSTSSFSSSGDDGKKHIYGVTASRKQQIGWYNRHQRRCEERAMDSSGTNSLRASQWPRQKLRSPHVLDDCCCDGSHCQRRMEREEMMAARSEGSAGQRSKLRFLVPDNFCNGHNMPRGKTATMLNDRPVHACECSGRERGDVSGAFGLSRPATCRVLTRLPCRSSATLPGNGRRRSLALEAPRALAEEGGGGEGASDVAGASHSGLRNEEVQKWEDLDQEEMSLDDLKELENQLSGKSMREQPAPVFGFSISTVGSNKISMEDEKFRTVRLVDPLSGRPLDCVIRRKFRNFDEVELYVLLPMDMPLQIFRNRGLKGTLEELSDEEFQVVLPDVAYALAKERLHLVLSGFCITARGSFCYAEEDVMTVDTENGESSGVEICSFEANERRYVIYTPYEPLIFVAYKDEATGLIHVAENDMLDDDSVLDALEEEKAFDANVEEEHALKETTPQSLP